MPIQARDIIDRMKQVGLDAEGTDHYRDDIDSIPAINAAIEWLVSVINMGFGLNKLSEEIFREINYTRMFQTNQFSRIGFNLTSLGHEVWTILSVFPEPEVYPTASVITPPTNPQDSLYRNDVTFLGAGTSGTAKRMTIEEWGVNINNPFVPGNDIVQLDELKNYGYINSSNYTSTSYTLTTIPREIELRPTLNKKFVGISYIAVPTKIAQDTDMIMFPSSFANILYEKALNYISRKQGDGTNIYGVTENDLLALIKSVS